MNARANVILQLASELPDIRAMKAERARRKLRHFLADYAWPVLQPATPFITNWHIDAVCEHLQAVAEGHIKRLIINMPFRMLKSTIVSQAFPAWEWIDHPHMAYLTASYAMDVATRDAVDCRRIIESDKYQSSWGNNFKMTTDQNVKTRYENDKRGSRVVTATTAAGTGFGGNRIMIDDPISALDANSETKRKESIEWFKGTASTRGNDPENDAIVITHQRTHDRDLSGYALTDLGDQEWVHLILPMRYQKKYHCSTKIGFSDPRKEENELLFPKRLPEKVVKSMESMLGTYHTSAQLQQRPTIRGGSVLKSEQFRRYTVPPIINAIYIYGDTAQKTAERNDYSVFETWGHGEDGKIYLFDLIRGKWEADDLKKRAIDLWNKWKNPGQLTMPWVGPVKLPCPRSMKIEDKSSGTGLIQQIKTGGNIPIFPIGRIKDKYTRFLDFQPYMEAGLVCIPENAPWANDLCAEVDGITADDTHDFDDQCDPMMDAAEDMLGSGNSMNIWAKLGAS